MKQQFCKGIESLYELKFSKINREDSNEKQNQNCYFPKKNTYSAAQFVMTCFFTDHK